MNYLAIYRKYRPKNFDEVSGQKIVVEILKNAIKNNKIAHAYLFAGPRGTGKTSIAKILARTINCELKDTTNPCEKCDSCINSSSKECVDIIEIDAASNNGVDEIRELKSKINIVPSFLKYKIYIIDEVHMLSIGAFNALLKTLEEPPSHVIFILATTELQKVPVTILSRCQILEFKKISPIDMKKRISEICEKENISIEDQAIDEIIDYSDGCMRDALSLLEKSTSFSESIITSNDIRNICGKVPKCDILSIIDYALNNDVENLLKKINELYLSDFELLYVIEDVLKELETKMFTNNSSQTQICSIASMFVEIYDKMKNSSANKKIIMEVELLQKLGKDTENISREIFLKQTFDKNEKVNNNEVENSNQQINYKENFPQIENINKPQNTPFNDSEFKKIRINNTFVDASKELLNEVKQKWEGLKKYAFDKKNGALICDLLDGNPVLSSQKYTVVSFPYSSMANNINEKYHQLEEILRQYAQIDRFIVAVSNEEWSNYKKEYIQNINNNIKYQTLEDTYINNKMNVENSEKKANEESESNNIEEKAYELFDSDLVEIE